MDAFRPGHRLTSDIELVRPVGEGGMGKVWGARHHKLGIDVVVKFLAESRVADELSRERFSREVASTVQVRSPHVVQLLDHGVTEDDVPYIVMELLDGEDLAAVLRRRGSLRADEMLHIVDGIASALTKAHERGIVHRDIKPANVFLCTDTPRPFVKLVDFGVAKRLEDATLTATNAFIGTPSFMSPEQIERPNDVDHRTDIWSVGVLAFLALTGEAPFRGETLASTVHAIMLGRAPKATDSKPELPASIDAWFERALAKDPARRFASAREMADALAGALAAVPVVRPGAGPIGLAYEETLEVSEPRGAASTLATAAVASAAAGAGTGTGTGSSSARRWAVALALTALVATIGLAVLRLVPRSTGEEAPPRPPVLAASTAPVASAAPAEPQAIPPAPSAVDPSATASTASAASAAPLTQPKAKPLPSPSRRPRSPGRTKTDDDIGF